MNERIHIVRESVVKLTQLLAGKGIQVTQCGINAYVKSDKNGRPFLVNLPYIPDNANSQLIDAIQGFLDHEVAHILFTEFTVMSKAQKAGCGGMLNLIEDSRIEREMANRFQGSALNLSNTGKFFLEKYTTPRMKEAISKGDQEELTGILMVPLIRAMAGQSAFKDFMRDKMHLIQDTYDKIKDLEKSIATIGSTGDALTLAKTITDRLKSTEPAPSASPPPPPSKSKTPPSSGQTGDGDGDDSSPSDPKEGKQDDEAKSSSDDPGEGEGEGGEKKSGSDGEGAGIGDEADAGEDDTSSVAIAAGEDESDEYKEGEKGKPSGDDAVDIGKSAAGTWEAIEKEMAKGYDDTVSAEITNSTASAAKESAYIIYSKDKDVVEPLHVGRDYKPKMLADLEDKVMHLVAPLQKDLERAISARSLSQYTAGHRSGRLHSANLSRLATGDARVFRRKQEATSKDVAVSLLIDMSGSMDGVKLTTATQAAYALASVLERIGITCEVLCFTTGEYISDASAMHAEEVKIGRKYSRVESLYMPILKSFNERLTLDVRSRFGWLPNSDSLRNNVDGESVEVAALRLMARRETGKILMVLSDGAPHASGGGYATLAPHLKKVVNDVSKAGVNVVGIGIQSEEVRKYYPKSLVLNNVNDLPSVVMKELRALIIH